MLQPSREDFRRRTGITDDDFVQVGALPLFAGLPDDVLMRALMDASMRRYPRGTILFMHGEPADRCFIVFEGWIKLFRETMDGHESVITVIGPGESFAEAAVFASSAFPVSCAAIEDARLLVIKDSSLLAEMRENPDMAFNMLATMSQRLRGLVRQIEQLTTRSTTERVAAFLVRLADGADGAAMITLPHDKSLIAGRLGMQPESFSRALSKLRSHGVTTSGRDVTIDDVAGLRAISEEGLG